MSLEVATPPVPEIPTEGAPAERRGEIASLLQEGAWADGFETWASSTRVTAAQWTIVRELRLLGQFAFFWDEFADRVGYHAPGIPEDWRERSIHPAVTSWETVSSINAGLTELGQAVSETLKAEYITWESSYEPPSDLPEF